MKNIFLTLLILVLFCLALNFIIQTEKDANSDYRFNFGLSLSGGSHLIYDVDLSKTPTEEIDDSFLALKNVIENRLNQFGFSEVIVQTQKPSLFGEDAKGKLLVDLPGVLNPEIAKEQIGKLPYLEFKIGMPVIKKEEEVEMIFNESLESEEKTEAQESPDKKESPNSPEKEIEPEPSSLSQVQESPEIEPQKFALEYIDVGFDGSYIESASVYNDLQTRQVGVNVKYNQEGAEIFKNITTQYQGQILAIFLDNKLISSPVIREVIPNGEAIISGNFSFEEARELARNLNFGALPLQLEISSVSKINPSLGENIIKNIILAGILGLIIISGILVYFYRWHGFIASISLLIYLALIVFLFKIFGIVLTVSGLAGIIISIGFAVDANVLIFERMREEKQSNNKISNNDLISNSFARSWTSIRDGNLSSFIISVIIFYLTSASVKGFAFVFGLSVIVSMFTTITLTRIFLKTMYHFNKKIC